MSVPREPNIFSPSPIEAAFAKTRRQRDIARMDAICGDAPLGVLHSTTTEEEAVADWLDDTRSQSDGEYQPGDEVESEGDESKEEAPREVHDHLQSSTKRKRNVQHVVHKSVRQIVVQWMNDDCFVNGVKGVCSRALRQFPEHFRSATAKANLEKARNWLANTDQILEDMIDEHTVNSITSSQWGKRVRVNVKCRGGQGRKSASWVLWLHDELLEEFIRLSKAGVKFNRSVLAVLAKDIWQNSTHDVFHGDYLDPKSQQHILQKLTPRWIEYFMERKNIVTRLQTGKLLCSPEKEEHIERSTAYHLGVLCKGFQSGELQEDLIENVDETHFVINMDDGKQLAFRGAQHVKYADVVQGGESMTMMVCLTGGPGSKLAIPMLIFTNRDRTYPMGNLPDIIPDVTYRTGPKGWNDRKVFLEYIKDQYFRKDTYGRTKILFMDNCSGHNDTQALQDALAEKRTELRFFPPCSTHLTQPVDSFIIQKIKDAWRNKWDEEKMRWVQQGKWSNKVRKDGKWSGKILNPGKKFFLGLVAYAVKEVNRQRDEAGLTYARRAMIRCGLALDVTRRWHVEQLTPELQAIVAKYKNHFDGEQVALRILGVIKNLRSVVSFVLYSKEEKKMVPRVE